VAATAWDRHTPAALAKLQDQLVAAQVRNSVAPFSPLWRRRFSELNRKASTVNSVAALESIPAMGERDVSPTGDPSGMAALVLQAGEAGFALYASGPSLRHAMRLRLTRKEAYQRVVDADTRSTSYVFSGSGMRYPIASTRADLDTIARAGARLWAVLGLTRNDVLLSGVQPGATTEHVALEYAAIGAGAPALFPGSTPEELAAAARLAPPTVLALPTEGAVEVLDRLRGLTSLRTVILVGAPSDAERLAATHAAHRAVGAGDIAVLAVHAPAGARVLWGECRESGGKSGLHAYPDLDVLQVVDPETGEHTAGGGELVTTQVGMRGSALLRWRTGDVVSGVTTAPCPSCRRVVPRAEGLSRNALVAGIGLDGEVIDLRAVASALSGRRDVRDWRIVTGRRARDGGPRVVVRLVPEGADTAGTVIGAAADIRGLAGALPTQIVLSDPYELQSLRGQHHSTRILAE
jgi:phenylacetate-coenzyme A ligase PaaK-like adenylate-forming protein